MAIPAYTVIGNPNVAFIRPELAELLPEYQTIRDALSGECTVKAQTEKYLPMPNGHDRSPENKARYKAYLMRAVFYNVTRRTVLAMIGQVFGKDPTKKLPTTLKMLDKNASGTGTSLDQLAQMSLGQNIAYARTGVFVDFPETNGAVSQEQTETGQIRPTMYVYSPMEIINWRVTEDGADEKLSLVVLIEGYPVSDDGFEVKNSAQFRVLKLDKEGNYIQEIWKEPKPSSWDGYSVPRRGNFQLNKTIKPTGPDGAPIKSIPFWFIGSSNNDINPDKPNMYDMASINMAHYRNSADYEEACYMVGQPTVVAVGLTEDWVNKVLGGKLTFGSRGGIPLPADADAKLLQAEERTMLKEAMDTKERQLTALGAKLVEQKTVQRTATESKQDGASQNSVLKSCTMNVSTAFTAALRYASWLMGGVPDDETIEYTLNTDFDIDELTPDLLRLVIEFWQKGMLTFKESRAFLRRANMATEEDDEAKAQIAKEQVEAFDLANENDPQFNPKPDPNKPAPPTND